MSELFKVTSESGEYAVRIAGGLLAEIVQKNRDAIYIVDSNLRDRLPKEGLRILEIEAAETSKSLEAAPEYIASLRRLGANRDTRLVVVGGGTVQDVATFLASIYMRGLVWIYMPSTVLAMDDSCIGGKSSINVLGYKNLVGNFHPPVEIVIDTDLITTLGEEMIIAGLFEAAKICFAHSQERFTDYLAMSPELAVSPATLQPIISLSLLTKKWFIEIDEFDKKERLLLNFGHTFGHAVESASDFAVSHGVGVGIGMLAACNYARDNGSLSVQGRACVDKLRTHVLTMLGPGGCRVMKSLPPLSVNKVSEMFEFDKKHKTEEFRLVLPVGNGQLQLVAIPRNDLSRYSIRKSFDAMFSELGWAVKL